MNKEILNFLEQVSHIPYWDRSPGIDDETLNKMITFLKEKIGNDGFN